MYLLTSHFLLVQEVTHKRGWREENKLAKMGQRISVPFRTDPDKDKLVDLANSRSREDIS